MFDGRIGFLRTVNQGFSLLSIVLGKVSHSANITRRCIRHNLRLTGQVIPLHLLGVVAPARLFLQALRPSSCLRVTRMNGKWTYALRSTNE